VVPAPLASRVPQRARFGLAVVRRVRAFFYPSIYLPISIYLSIYPSIHLSIYLPTYLSTYLSTVQHRAVEKQHVARRHVPAQQLVLAARHAC
jgi:hypothetical protein